MWELKYLVVIAFAAQPLVLCSLPHGRDDELHTCPRDTSLSSSESGSESTLELFITRERGAVQMAERVQKGSRLQTAPPNSDAARLMMDDAKPENYAP
ncbi:hypothetical protein KOW79_017093 [Hemibagrus wyckioides]|uniref:Secreted protein n=1 Tax=Hemibagrus wyckioides TaxID=337641 RepID=A0A9D3NFB3_9TELE|nr:hypothetical protein KOW79_017093 [Hemibagrus wyckioides]